MIIIGVLRFVTWRVLTPPSLKIGFVTAVPTSSASPRTMPPKFFVTTPCEPTMSSLSETTGDSRSFGLESRWKGNRLSLSVEFGAPFSKSLLAPGWSVFLLRWSTPPAKWQVPHDTAPSLAACMSQKKALPSWTQALRSLTTVPRFDGSGTATFLRDIRPPFAP